MKSKSTLNAKRIAGLAGGAALMAAALSLALPGSLASADREAPRHRPEARSRSRSERREQAPVLSEEQAARLRELRGEQRALRREIRDRHWEVEMAAAKEKLGLSDAQIEKLRALRRERLELIGRLNELRERRLERLRSEVGLSDEQIAGLCGMRRERGAEAMKEMRGGRGYDTLRRRGRHTSRPAQLR